ncbi:MAG: hypothetical protein AAFY88_18690, partial [Acidobacteriota bacterium]
MPSPSPAGEAPQVSGGEAPQVSGGEAPQIVIVCGGKGTRLAGAIGDLPKILTPIDGSPLLE